jgi:hypothetical protein
MIFLVYDCLGCLPCSPPKFSKEQWICHPARHCQCEDFCGFTKQVGDSSLKNLPDQRKFRPVLMDSPPLSEIFTGNRGYYPDGLTSPFELIPRKFTCLASFRSVALALLRTKRISSVRGLETHDQHAVGDGIRSRARGLYTNPQVRQRCRVYFSNCPVSGTTRKKKTSY